MRWRDASRLAEILSVSRLCSLSEEDLASLHQALGLLDLPTRNHQGDLGATAQEILERNDHLLTLGELDLAAQIIRPLDQDLGPARVLADLGEQLEGLLVVAPPQPAGERLDGLGGEV